jgi:acetyltransferase-like isoleucine patch superfamily enzyme
MEQDGEGVANAGKAENAAQTIIGSRVRITLNATILAKAINKA